MGLSKLLRVLEDKDEIEKAQTVFMKKLAKKADRTEELSVGYPGGSEIGPVSWSKALGMWWVHKPESNRFWNGFGTEEVQWSSKHSHTLDCEINPPYEGINRRIAGVFAKDENGELFLLHRGKIGGGRPGIGKNLFLNNYRGKWITVKDGDQLSNLALVASFKNPRFVIQVTNFVKEVKRIKRNATNNQMTSLSVKHDLIPVFKEEFSGKRKTSTISNQIEAKCDHGIIVNSLAKKFENEGIRVGNSMQIDLFTTDSSSNQITLFEIKTGTTSTNIYEAIGQLYYYSTILRGNCSLVAVFPKTLERNQRKILNKLNIQCLTYDWIDGKPKFIKFDARSYV